MPNMHKNHTVFDNNLNAQRALKYVVLFSVIWQRDFTSSGTKVGNTQHYI